MRWDDLFDDLEAQLSAAEQADLAAEVTDRTRREAALVPLADRWRAARGALVGLLVQGAGQLAGEVLDVGPDWLLIQDTVARQTLVPQGAVLAVTGLGPTAEGPQPVAARLRLGHALRGIARDRAPVLLVLRDGTVLAGTLDRVGADYVDLAEHPVGEPRRRGDVRAVHAVPFSGLAAVRSS